MDTETIKRLKRVYLGFRTYREKRRNEPFEITQDEWMTFVSGSDELMQKIAGNDGSRYLERHDPELAWTIENLNVRDRRATVSKSKAISMDDIEIRILTKIEWANELRAAKADQLHK